MEYEEERKGECVIEKSLCMNTMTINTKNVIVHRMLIYGRCTVHHGLGSRFLLPVHVNKQSLSSERFTLYMYMYTCSSPL